MSWLVPFLEFQHLLVSLCPLFLGLGVLLADFAVMGSEDETF